MRSKRKDCVAMILAGGQGSRLGILTQKLAKPAVPFGGKYRIIDFTLSNCANSNINTIGVLTQYQPMILNTHIGIGKPWDLDRGKDQGVTLLSPYVDVKGGEWFKGTANAIYQNIYYIDQLNTEHVLVLSGDHIYKMDYAEMLSHHKEKEADATISVIEVPLDEASRFGIMNTTKDGEVYEFEEKPENPKNNLASMGIYIFKWKELRKYLIEDENDENSSHDFGHDIIPKMLNEGKKLNSYRFQGYWKDVGTIESLWQANMDLLTDSPELDLFDKTWKIYTENTNHPPHYVCDNAKISRTLINEGCEVCGEIEHSIIFQCVKIGENSKVKDCLIFPNVTIEDNVVIEKAIIGENSYIKSGTVINSESTDRVGENFGISESGIVVIGEYSVI
jgi:glucose-1-phosphate adenylyltransferase